jgi:hypothetical protein
VTLADPYGSSGTTNPFPGQFGPLNPSPSDAIFPTSGISFSQIFDRHFRLPMVLSWNLTAEHGFKQDWMLRVAYVGNSGHHLSGTGDQENGLLQLNPQLGSGYAAGSPRLSCLWIDRFHQFRSRQQLQCCPDHARKAHDARLLFSDQLYMGQGTG